MAFRPQRKTFSFEPNFASRLKSQIAHCTTVNRFAGKLADAGVITIKKKLEVWDLTSPDNAEKLVDSVADRVREDHRRLERFIEILKEEPPLVDIANEMAESFQGKQLQQFLNMASELRDNLTSCERDYSELKNLVLNVTSQVVTQQQHLQSCQRELKYTLEVSQKQTDQIEKCEQELNKTRQTIIQLRENNTICERQKQALSINNEHLTRHLLLILRRMYESDAQVMDMDEKLEHAKNELKTSTEKATKKITDLETKLAKAEKELEECKNSKEAWITFAKYAGVGTGGAALGVAAWFFGPSILAAKFV